MKRKLLTLFVTTIFLFSMSLAVDAKKGKPKKCEIKGVPDQECFFYGDARADAPELAYRGSFDVGVRTLEVVNPNQIDILNYSIENPDPRYDRPLTLEVWYPAKRQGKKEEVTTYQDVLGSGPDNPDRPLIPFEFAGRALRNAKPNSKEGPYPLVIVSHGYPGSRVLLTYLTENLASKGYVVVAIDHTESTHADKVGFESTLLNRTLDINFVIDDMAQRGASKGKKFLAGAVNADVAFLGIHLKGMEEYQAYLDLIPISIDASPGESDYWNGFKDWTAVGLELHHIEP